MNNIQYRTNQLKDYLQKINNQLTLEKTLAQINIVLSRVCNRKCSFCPNSDKKKIAKFNHMHPRYISMDIVDMIIKECKEQDFKGTFSLAGFGEPTFHPDLELIIGKLNIACPEATINLITNGDNQIKINTLAKKYPNLLITFSEYSEQDTKRNNKVYKHIKNKKQKEQYKEENKKNLNNRAGNVAVGPNAIPDKPCYVPYFKTTVDTDGTILICDNDWFANNPIANIKDIKLYDAWIAASKPIKIAMYDHNRKVITLCSKCNANGTLYGGDFAKFYREEMRKRDSSR